MTDYSTRLDDLETLLAEIAPDRVITRTYKDFSRHKAEDLRQGIYTIVSAGVSEYPVVYEPGDDGRQKVLIIFQGKVDEGADGPTLEAFEFAALNELESLAEQAPIKWPTLTLQSAATSKQLENPYCWVRSDWQTFTDSKS